MIINNNCVAAVLLYFDFNWLQAKNLVNRSLPNSFWHV